MYQNTYDLTSKDKVKNDLRSCNIKVTHGQNRLKCMTVDASWRAEHNMTTCAAVSFLCLRSYGQKPSWPRVVLCSSLKPKCNYIMPIVLNCEDPDMIWMTGGEMWPCRNKAPQITDSVPNMPSGMTSQLRDLTWSRTTPGRNWIE